MPKELYPYIPIAIVLLLVLRRAGRTQKVNVRRLWIAPILGVVAAGTSLAQEPVPGISALAIFAIAFVVGAAAGYYRAFHTQLSLDPQTRDVTSKSTPVGTILIVFFLFVRIALDYAFKGGIGPAHSHFLAPSKHGVDVFRLADAALIFTTAMMLGQRVEILRRTHLLLRSSAQVPTA